MPAKRNPKGQQKEGLSFFFVLSFSFFLCLGCAPAPPSSADGPPTLHVRISFHVVPTLAVVGSLVVM